MTDMEKLHVLGEPFGRCMRLISDHVFAVLQSIRK